MKKKNRGASGYKRILQEDRDWDFSFMWRLEHRKLEKMLKYWTSGKPYCIDSKTSSVVRDLKLCLKLMDIFMDECSDKVWEVEFPGMHTIPSPDRPGCSQLVEDNPGDPGVCKKIGYINLRNSERILGWKHNQARLETTERLNSERGYPNALVCSLENDLYREKARHLYHLIRTYKEETWWD